MPTTTDKYVGQEALEELILKVKSALPEIDSSISSTSTNPVQNKVIYDEFVSRQNTLKEIYEVPSSTTSLSIYTTTSDGLPRVDATGTDSTTGFLKPGIYKIAPTSNCNIYYYGTLTTTSEIIAADKVILLYIYRFSTTYYKWYYIISNEDGGANPILHAGTTYASGGTAIIQPLFNLIQQTSTTTTAGKVLTSTTTSGRGQWTDMDTTPTSASTVPITSGGVYTALSGKEDNSNKVTSLSSSSTDTQYPSAKCVYDLVGDVDALLQTLNNGQGV